MNKAKLRASIFFYKKMMDFCARIAEAGSNDGIITMEDMAHLKRISLKFERKRFELLEQHKVLNTTPKFKKLIP